MTGQGRQLFRQTWVDVWLQLAEHRRVGPLLEVGRACGCPVGVVLYEAVTWNV